MSDNRFQTALPILSECLRVLNDPVTADEHVARAQLVQVCSEIVLRWKTVDTELPRVRPMGQS